MDAEIEVSVKRIVGDEMNSFKNEFLTKMESLFTTKFKALDAQQKERSESQLTRIQNEIMAADSYKFQKKSCEDQYIFNQKLAGTLKEAEANLGDMGEESAAAKQKIAQGIEMIAFRQKLIKLADSSEGGWKVVHEYTANPLAEDSEDDKKIFRAQARAERKMKVERVKRKRFTPYSKASTSANADNRNNAMRAAKPGICYCCFKPGHWQFECPEKKKLSKSLPLIQFLSTNERDIMSSKLNSNELEGGRELKQQYGCEKDIILSNESTIGRLKKAVDVWKKAGASDYILKVIDEGYGIPFKVVPESVVLNNNKSSLENACFVESEISKLLERGCISEVKNLPAVINPLTVARNKSGKPRLVLDCRHINSCIHQFKFKLEDGTVARNLFCKGDFLFKFDLKSAYHHIEILEEHRKYLGFRWN